MLEITPSLHEFEKLARRGNLIPLSCEILADQDTPVSAFLKLGRGRHGFLLESVEGGERWARYSFLGTGTSWAFRCRGREVEFLEGGKSSGLRRVADPFLAFRDFMKQFQPVRLPGMPRFYGGAVGYLGYDTSRCFERLPSLTADTLGIWDIYLVIPESLLIFDNIRHTIRIVSCCYLPSCASPGHAYRKTVARIERAARMLHGPVPHQPPPRPGGALRVQGTLKRGQYLDAVRRAKRHVRQGDIIQVVLSQRLQAGICVEPFSLYRSLRFVNPSPYMFYLQYPDYAVVGSSPEVLVRVESPCIEVRPIAGTRPRGADARADRKFAEDLRRDEKEIAEHIMLVDLGRNDVGRVAAPGSVRVEELMSVERYSHVMHMVSHVKGRLGRGRDCFDAFRSCFPAGTLTGAPKIRAMEIIEELEPERRGIYGGAVGYFSFSGNMDMAIAIRTVLAMPDRLFFQAGAGIVADSRPEREYQECLNKARAMVKAIEMARRGVLLSDDWEDRVIYDLHD